MKKLFVVSLSLLCIFSLVACGQSKQNNEYEEVDPCGFLANNVLDMTFADVKSFASGWDYDEQYGTFIKGVNYMGKNAHASISTNNGKVDSVMYQWDEPIGDFIDDATQKWKAYFGEYEFSLSSVSNDFCYSFNNFDLAKPFAMQYSSENAVMPNRVFITFSK